MSLPHVIPTSKLENIHPVIRKLFSAKEVPKLPLVGRLKHFVKTWKILTKDSELLELKEGPTKRIRSHKKRKEHLT